MVSGDTEMSFKTPRVSIFRQHTCLLLKHTWINVSVAKRGFIDNLWQRSKTFIVNEELKDWIRAVYYIMAKDFNTFVSNVWTMNGGPWLLTTLGT